MGLGETIKIIYASLRQFCLNRSKTNGQRALSVTQEFMEIGGNV